MKSFSNRQMEVSNLLQSINKEGQGVPSDVTDEIIAMVGDAESRSVNATSIKNSENTESLIRLKLLDETDWRKRAALCALLISRSLD